MKKLLHIATSLLVVMVLLMAGAVSVPAVQAQSDGPENAAPLLEKAQQDGSVRVIVGLKAPFNPDIDQSGPDAALAQQQAIRAAQDELLGRLEGVTEGSVKQFEYIPFLALEVNAAGMAALASDPAVASLEEDTLMRPSLAQSTPLVGAPAAWTAGYSGLNQVVAVLDTGVDKNHPLLSGKVVSEACYSTNNSSYSASSVCPGGVTSSTASGSAMPYGGNCPAGECDHGTHVAGIAAGKASGSYTYNGVAKDANLIAVQVFTRFDSTYYCGTSSCALSFKSDQVLGLQRVYALRGTYNIAAVNMSLGGGRYYDQATCDADNASTKAQIDLLRAAGIATVIASGNEYYEDSMGAPGCISSAVSVGSTGDGSGGATQDVVMDYSNSASFLNLLAPGSKITSSIPGNSQGTWDGTSMATPHVAGAWAVLRSKVPTASVNAVLSALTSTGLAVTDSRNSITKPRIRVDQAAAALTPAGAYTISGTVTFNSAPLAGVLVSTGVTGATTNASGVYTISGLGAGAYTLTPSLSGYSFSPPSRSVTITNASLSGQDFSATAITVGNDLIGDATVLTYDGGPTVWSDTISTVGATTSLEDPRFPRTIARGGQFYKSVWYQFTPATGGTLKINTKYSTYDTIAGIWRDVSGVMKSTKLSDSAAFSATLKAGTTYFIEVVSKKDTGGTLNFTATWSPSRPSNEGWGSAKRIPAYGSTAVADVYKAHRESADKKYFSPYTVYHSVWYKWTAPASGTFSIDLDEVNYYNVITVWSKAGCFPGSSPLKASAPDGSEMSYLQVERQGPDAPWDLYVKGRCTYQIGVGAYYSDVSNGSLLRMTTSFQ